MNGNSLFPWKIWGSRFLRKSLYLSILASVRQQHLGVMVSKLRALEPDLSNQEPTFKAGYDAFLELKIRGVQAFQVSAMLDVVARLNNERAKNTPAPLLVVDIGDSAGTHMFYLKKILQDIPVQTLSVNLDPRAIVEIRKRNLEALLCRAENLDVNQYKVDFYTSFEMMEHLHDPTRFLRNLSKGPNGKYLLVTVPYLKSSRVGLHSIRKNLNQKVYAQEEHIFELSPTDWSLLMQHAGWKSIWSKIYYQYPRGLPIVSGVLKKIWQSCDYEGFWCCLLVRDRSHMENYADWEDC